ncbi:ankyrin, partial [Stipitochalara longipes BDJ]
MLESAGFTTQDAAGNGLLQIAALGGHSKVAAMLLDRGISINSVDRNHGTALQAAIYMARAGPNGVIRLLLDWGKAKSPNGNFRDKINVNTKGGYYGCALQVAAYRANSDLVRELVNDCDPKADVNICGGKFGFPLQAAVRTGRRAVVEPILSAETDINAKGGKYGTALQAVAKGKYRQRETLPEISRAQVLGQEVPNSLGKPIDLHNNAGEKDYREVANMLFDKGAKMDGGSGMLDNPINAAASSGDPEMLNLMLDHFDNPDWKEDKCRVLTKALLTAITLSPEKQLKLVKSLVQSGASIQYEISGSLPSLPLEAAASRDLLHVVEYLLEAKDNQKRRVDLSAESGIHGTALRAAIAAESERVAQCLITYQAKEFKIQQLPIADSSNSSTRIPTDEPRNLQALAISSTQATAGLAISAPAGPNETPSAKDIENVRNRAELICRDAEYGNILQLATSRGLVSTVDLLLKYGADPNIQDTSDRRALHIASWFGFPGVVDLLLTYGADINAKDEWGATARDQAEESLDRDGHPGGSEADLQRIRQTFANRLGEINREIHGTEFKGPKKIRTVKKSTTEAKSGRDEEGMEKPTSEETKAVSREVRIGTTETARIPAEDISTPENVVNMFPKA